jgi:hypothetical protein
MYNDLEMKYANVKEVDLSNIYIVNATKDKVNIS